MVVVALVEVFDFNHLVLVTDGNSKQSAMIVLGGGGEDIRRAPEAVLKVSTMARSGRRADAFRGCLIRSFLARFVTTRYEELVTLTSLPFRSYIASSLLFSTARAFWSPCTKRMVWGQRRMRFTKFSRSFWSAWAE